MELINLTFQSPTSRGGLCNWGVVAVHGEEGWSFNPLLRGAASATVRASRSRWPATGVSIPYFAGRPLQLGQRPRGGATWRLFQSPTSRGGLCNLCPPPGQTLAPGFNPLLRGAASATCAPHRVRPSPQVSIPYFAGRPLQRVTVEVTDLAIEGFNPLLRGAASATSRRSR